MLIEGRVYGFLLRSQDPKNIAEVLQYFYIFVHFTIKDPGITYKSFILREIENLIFF